MTNAFKSIQQGLTETIAHAKTKDTETTGVKLYQPYAVNVSDLRQRLSLTQEQFAFWFFSRHTAALGAWRPLSERRIAGTAQRD
jgi:DNA-binding transcriptional regulator YiaG